MISGGSSPEGFSGAMSYLNWVGNQSLVTILRKGFGAWLAAIATGFVTTTQWLVNLAIVTPAKVLSGVIEAAGDAFGVQPLSVISDGATATGEAIGGLGILALPASVAIALGSYYLIVQYRQEEETSDFLPGAVSDLPVIGTDEEAEADD